MKDSWDRDVSNLLIINGIFTALSVILIPLVMQNDKAFGDNWLPPIILLIFTFGLFALVAAKMAEAVEQENIKKYVSYLFLYNLAVIMLFFSIGLIIYYHYLPSGTALYVLALSILIVSLPWIRDFFWMILVKKADFDKYIAGLKGEKEPQVDYWMFSFTKMFWKLRKWKK
ncbi:MAG: hypothetical protein PHH21_02635 [Candidatus Pacebacteria bacterium]|nr:hypothetical protein [Candidatus Paceibacterota bacterium]